MTDFIDLIASGEASQAKDTLNDMLSSKAFQALEIRKQEIAQKLYGNNVIDNSEVENTETVETNETEYTEE